MYAQPLIRKVDDAGAFSLPVATSRAPRRQRMTGAIQAAAGVALRIERPDAGQLRACGPWLDAELVRLTGLVADLKVAAAALAVQPG
jgi:hypothetical protein